MWQQGVELEGQLVSIYAAAVGEKLHNLQMRDHTLLQVLLHVKAHTMVEHDRVLQQCMCHLTVGHL